MMETPTSSLSITAMPVPLVVGGAVESGKVFGDRLLVTNQLLLEVT